MWYISTRETYNSDESVKGQKMDNLVILSPGIKVPVT